jgi:hypothetical protein
MTVPTQVPASLIAGDTWEWTRTLADYPASLWTAAWYFENVSADRPRRFSVAAVADGDVFTADVVATTTAGYAPVSYAWMLTVTRIADSVRKTVESGRLEVRPNPAASGNPDTRSTARVVLEMIDTYLRDPTNLAAASYSLAGRSLSRWSRTDLLVERDKWTQEVRSEEAVENMSKGLGNPRRLYVRFDRA